MKYFFTRKYFLAFFFLAAGGIFPFNKLHAQFFTPIDKKGIECSNNMARSWWDVLHYDLSVDFTDTTTDSIKGVNIIMAKVVEQPNQLLQIDLDTHLKITKVFINDKSVLFEKRGSSTFLVLSNKVFYSLSVGDTFFVRIVYEGKPQEALNPPWDGGFVRKKDKEGHTWWAVACQGEGASLWFPCKNFQGDEPDLGVTESYTVPASLKAIGNGRLVSEKPLKKEHTKIFTWKVVNPINNYDITFYIGNYVHWSDTFNGLKGKLDLNYYVLPEDLQKAKKQFTEVKTMLCCFENHFGPYPFYEDGYKLVEAPYLGMEHQSAIAYGNHFEMGYLGQDRSRTGVGLLFDFIIVHESAHEWFGNSITAYDKADDWIHEGFASYAETVYAECIAGKEKAFEYQRGKRRTIENKMPVEGRFNECDEGSGDEYDKAGFMIHMIREIMNNDTEFFDMLKAMNAKFYHKIVSGKQIEDFISAYAHRDFTKFFDQYLKETQLPTLVLERQSDDSLVYYWKNCVQGFNMPVKWSDGNQEHWLYPYTTPKKVLDNGLNKASHISQDFLIRVKFKLE